MSFIILEIYIKLCVEVWILALKKWLISRGHMHKSGLFKLQPIGGRVINVFGGLHLLACLVMQANGSLG